MMGRRRATRFGGALLPVAVLVVEPAPCAAQAYASEPSSLSQTISGTVVEIDYSRPSIRGREVIFGDQVPWGELWTAGANASSTIRFSKDVRLEGHEVPAGKYGLWLQPNEDDPWMFVLHPDTTLYHVPHPPIEEGFLSFPFEPRETAGFLETLRWDLQRVRPTGARLQMHWGHTLVSVELAVDPGFRMTVTSDVGRMYAGEWSLRSVPSDPDAEPPAPRRLDLSYDAEGQQIRGVQHFPGGGSSEFVLLPRAEGIFVAGYLMRGEVASSSPNYWEFTFENGEPTEFVVWNAEDEIVSRGARAGGRPSTHP